MPIGTQIPVEELEQLAATIASEASQVEAALQRLRSQCERSPSFQGNAATKYDQFLQQWDASQRQMLESIRGAGNILSRLAQVTRENEMSAASALDI